MYTVLFLRPYSLDLNSIEHYWSTLKRELASNAHRYHSVAEAVDSLLQPCAVAYGRVSVNCCTEMSEKVNYCFTVLGDIASKPNLVFNRATARAAALLDTE